MDFIHPLWLLLLPLSVLPFMVSISDNTAISSIKIFEQDGISKKITMLCRSLMSLIIFLLVVILANPWSKSTSITEIGKGAQLVFLIDRSVSMAKPFIGDDDNKSEIKSLAARRILKDFIDQRPSDMIGIVGFSNSALYASKITKNRSYTYAAIDAATGSSINQTNIGSGITSGLFMFSEIETTGSQALVLLSDGAGKISKRVKERIAEMLNEKKINLYWIIIKEPNDVSLFSGNTYLEGREPTVIKLDNFFKSLKTEYKAYEAENPDALSSAIADIDQKEKKPIKIERDIPGKNYNPSILKLLLALIVSLIAIKNIKV
ncbi:MAG: VWA domain-containing protein [Nitrosomonadales bacterium]|uniref:von Willebrand factor, type A n=1 Tax=Methylophilales bacterium HTCC2181 TaxID=383631 RepID=A0P745_9PROT|nr:von Willebrand factor, type A [Methylophilales bacterium HTCC2181]MBT3512983.1 VWA domain-containing protein [Nitrosomonadales bacterium]MBT5411519.1 VWA domain-containing protein [Nitrosomonadales bacterium]MDC0552796.1 VWA domain-containing protein [Methylophilaceae bacterium]|tara:strand:- start:18 stop:974 length:957 start_codon:yes stop_codon:yes gene_type:complete